MHMGLAERKKRDRLLFPSGTISPFFPFEMAIGYCVLEFIICSAGPGPKCAGGSLVEMAGRGPARCTRGQLRNGPTSLARFGRA